MTRAFGFSLDGLAVSLEASPLLLDEGDLTTKLEGAGGVSRAVSGADTRVVLFTIPADVVEELWTDDIRARIAGDAPTMRRWGSLEVLAFLLESTGSGFATLTAAEFFLHRAVDQGVVAARCAASRNSAWLNLDGVPQRLRLSRNGEQGPAVHLRLGAGEGLAWDARVLQVEEDGGLPAQSAPPTSKLLLFGA